MHRMFGCGSCRGVLLAKHGKGRSVRWHGHQPAWIRGRRAPEPRPVGRHRQEHGNAPCKRSPPHCRKGVAMLIRSEEWRLDRERRLYDALLNETALFAADYTVATAETHAWATLVVKEVHAQL